MIQLYFLSNRNPERFGLNQLLEASARSGASSAASKPVCSLEAHVRANSRADVLGLLLAFRNPVGFRVCGSSVHALAAAPCTHPGAEHLVTRALSRTYVRTYALHMYVFLSVSTSVRTNGSDQA